MKSNASNKYYNETVRDKLILSPLDKYIKYDRYPYKMVLSLALVILTTLATFNLLNIYSLSGQAQIKVWKNVLNLDDTPNGENFFLSIPDFQTHLFSLIDNLQNINNIFFQKIDDSDAKYFIEVIPMYPVADTQVYKNNNLSEESTSEINPTNFLENNSETHQNQSFFEDNYTYNVDLNEGVLQPFNLSSAQDIKGFLQRVHKFSFRIKNMKLYTNTQFKTVDYHTCWDVDVHYSFHNEAFIMAKSVCNFMPCNNVNENGIPVDSTKLLSGNKVKLNQLEYSEKFMGDSVITLHLAIFLFGAVSLILHLKYIYEMMQVYIQTLIKSKSTRMKESVLVSEYSNETDIQLFQKKISVKAVKSLEKLLETDKPWHMLTFREKMLFFDFWFILGIVGNMVHIWASILVFAQEIGSNDYHGTYDIEILIGFSCFLAWFNIIRYLEYNKNIFTISNILRKSLPQMLFFIIGFIPIFMAYVFLGVSLFWRYEKFKNPNEATISLFSLIMGDSIYYFITTVRGYGLLSLIYFFSFLIIFFMAIQNIFVSIICSKAREKDPEPKNAEKANIPSVENQVDDSKSDIQDLMIVNSEPRKMKKLGSLENMSESAMPLWQSKGLTRNYTSNTPKSSSSRANEQLGSSQMGARMSQFGISQMGVSRIPNALERRVSNPNALVSQEGPLKNLLRTVTLRARTNMSMKNLKNLEELEFEKDRIIVRLKHDTESTLWFLDTLAKENVELEFYKLTLRDQVIIRKEYLVELSHLSEKLKELIHIADKLKKDLKSGLI